MTNLQFSINSAVEPKKLMSFITDFEYYQKFFPSQIKEVKILERQNNEIITEETITFSTLIKSPFIQKSRHRIISDKELFTEILEGPAKGSVIKIICNKNNQGSQITFDADLKLSLKAKLLAPFIKKLYKRYLTAVIYKISELERKQQDSN
jgi:ribosome-associated toxin RatA of RatAB toxin-antitoxin module|tara:strand:+ start:1361 stop:1813 length:453 start_codon:yes stop_codon:yes gene_type:complete